MGELLQFRLKMSDVTGGESPKTRPTISVSETVGYKPEELIDTKDLYPLRAELNPTLNTALKLLNEGLKHVNEALEMLAENDLIASDDALQRFHALLPELFCCRELGDGFGAIVNSIFHSLKNMKGIPPTEEQLKMIRNLVTRIYTEPFISFEESVEEVILLESVELDVAPSHFKYAADMLSE